MVKNLLKKFFLILKKYITFIKLVLFSDTFKNNFYTNQHILKKYFKLLKNIIFIALITMQMPDILIDYINDLSDNEQNDTESKMTDKDKQIIMGFFILMSTFLSYVLNNYHCEAPRYYTPKPPFPPF